VSIEPGQAHLVFLREDVVNRVLESARVRVLRAEAQDALWRNKRSPKFIVDLIKASD